MKFWINLQRLTPQSVYVKYERIHDEEHLGAESGPERRHRRTNQRVTWPSGSTVFLILVNIVVVGVLLHTLEPLITLMRRNKELFSPLMALPSSSTLYDPNRTAPSSLVPLILHQTAPTETIPDHWVRSQASCKRAYSGFEYKLWTDSSARDFLVNHYPWFVDTWDRYAFPIQRADSIRYFILYHYGGIYLDMDTWCNETLPVLQLGSGTGQDYAWFKSTLPTGVSNDFLVASANHPAYAAAIARLPAFNDITRVWARWQPHCAIMISAGPMFLTMVLKDYLLRQPLLPSPTLGVIGASALAPYITDLESSTWHHADTKVLVWIGERPWIWFSMGLVALAAGLVPFNCLLISLYDFARMNPSEAIDFKVSKAA